MTTQVHPEKVAGLVVVVLFAMVAGGVQEASAMTPLPEPVTVRTSREAQLYATIPPVLAILRRGERVVLIAEKGKWSLVRYLQEDGKAVEGLVWAGALVRLGDKAEALRDTRLYAATRPVLATIPEGSAVTIVGFVPGGYIVRYSPTEAEPQQGIVATDTIPETDAISAARQAIAEAAMAKARADAEARQAKANPILLLELLAIADDYLSVPADETQAARDQRREKIITKLIGRRVHLSGRLQDVVADQQEGFRASLKYESARQIEYKVGMKMFGRDVTRKEPAESITANLITDDQSVTRLTKQSEVTVEGTITKIVFEQGGVSMSIQQRLAKPMGIIRITLTLEDGTLR